MNDEQQSFVRDLRLAEQSLMRESLEVKAERIHELESEVFYLRRLLNETLAVPRVQPSASAMVLSSPRPLREIPARWRA